MDFLKRMFQKKRPDERRLKWFMAFNEICHTYEHFERMIRVAAYSALTNTSLEPHFIFDGSPNELTEWLEAKGVTVWFARSSFYDDLKQLSEERDNQDILKIGSGAFIRVDIPELARTHGLDDELALYTDCDVLFLKDPTPILHNTPCPRFAVGPEFDAGDYRHMNTGVMLMNLRSLREDLPDFKDYIRLNLGDFVNTSWDQQAYRQYYQDPRPSGNEEIPDSTLLWDRLPPTLNWKPYWGVDPKAVVVHFHGVKPFMEKALRAGEAIPELLNLANAHYYEHCRVWNDYLRESGG